MSWTNGLAELASNAALFAGWIASQSMLTSKSWTQWTLLERIIYSGWLGKKLAERGEHASNELGHENLVDSFVGESRTDIVIGQRHVAYIIFYGTIE